nr:MAG TPA: hypothetical protein [Caudoviricetes sp.]
MVYKLAEEDKLCGVIYPTYEGFSPIPKATCEMLESKCDELDIEITCGGKKKEEEIPNTVDEEAHTNEVLGNNRLENIPKILVSDYINRVLKVPDEATIDTFKKTNKTNLENKLGKGYTVNILVNNQDNVGDNFQYRNSIVIEVTTPSGKKISHNAGLLNISYLDDHPPYSEDTSTSVSESTSESTTTSMSTSENVSGSTTTSTSTSESSSPSTSETPTENNNTSDIPKEVTDLFKCTTLNTFFVVRGNPYRAMYLKEDTENGLNSCLMDTYPSSNYLTYKDIFTIDNIYLKEKLDNENEPETATMVINLTLYTGEKKTLELPKQIMYVDSEPSRPAINPNIPSAKSQAPDTSDLEIKELTDNYEFYYGNITPTNDGNIGALVGNNGKPITPEELEKQSEVFSEEIKKVLGDRVTQVEVNIVPLLNVGDHIGVNRTKFHSAFRLDIDLVKRNGSHMTLYELATTSVIDTL